MQRGLQFAFQLQRHTAVLLLLYRKSLRFSDRILYASVVRVVRVALPSSLDDLHLVTLIVLVGGKGYDLLIS
jgi:hypothetical protein